MAGAENAFTCQQGLGFVNEVIFFVFSLQVSPVGTLVDQFEAAVIIPHRCMTAGNRGVIQDDVIIVAATKQKRGPAFTELVLFTLEFKDQNGIGGLCLEVFFYKYGVFFYVFLPVGCKNKAGCQACAGSDFQRYDATNSRCPGHSNAKYRENES